MVKSLVVHRRVEDGDIPVLVISVVGRRRRALRADEREVLGKAVAAALAAEPDVEVAVLDVTGAHLPWAEEDAAPLTHGLDGLAWVWAAPEAARDALDGSYGRGGDRGVLDAHRLPGTLLGRGRDDRGPLAGAPPGGGDPQGHRWRDLVQAVVVGRRAR